MQSRAGLLDLVNANDIRGVFSSSLFERHAVSLGAALADFFAEPQHNGGTAAQTLLLGFDARVSSPVLAEALATGARARGLDVTWLGHTSTDQVYFASGQRQAPAVMITASHNPGEYNGFKVCAPGARPIGRGQGLLEIARRADTLDADELSLVTKKRGNLLSWDSLPEYSAFLIKLAGLNSSQGGKPRKLRVVVDAANGMAGVTAPQVMDDLGFVKLVKLYCELDGSFPNHPADPLNYANLVDLQAAVIAHKADLGLAFDGDADRCFFIDETGGIVSPSAVTALVAAREIAGSSEHSSAGANSDAQVTVVHNAITSQIVPETIEASGARAVVSKVGHAYVKGLMAEHDAVFGGEHSAHYYFRDFYFADSGMLAALHVMAALQAQPEATLSGLVAQYDPYFASGEINSRVTDAAAAVARVRSEFAGKKREISEFDGLTISQWGDSDPLKRWWLNVRVSNTEPLLRLNVEATTPEMMEFIRDAALLAIRQPMQSDDDSSSN